jgi:hypothetical protein
MARHKFICPHCGNSHRDLITDNGYRWSHPDCTLLCIAPVPAGEEDSFGDLSDGTATCRMQWEPGEVDDDDVVE